MKFFATLALILASTEAVRLHHKATSASKVGNKLRELLSSAPPAESGPTAEEMIAEVDKDGNGKVSKAELLGFVNALIEKECAGGVCDIAAEKKKFAAEVEHFWPMLDSNGDGEVDKAELEAAMASEM